MKLVLFLYFSIIFCSYSKVLMLEQYNGPSKELTAVLFNNSLIDEDCAKRLGNCLAYKSLSSKLKKTNVNHHGLIGNPASKACMSVNGKPVILKDINKNQSQTH